MLEYTTEQQERLTQLSKQLSCSLAEAKEMKERLNTSKQPKVETGSLDQHNKVQQQEPQKTKLSIKAKLKAAKEKLKSRLKKMFSRKNKHESLGVTDQGPENYKKDKRTKGLATSTKDLEQESQTFSSIAGKVAEQKEQRWQNSKMNLEYWKRKLRKQKPQQSQLPQIRI